MYRRKLSLDAQMEDLYLHSIYSEREDNNGDRNKMKKMLYNAMNKTLTDRQLDCLTMYYFDNKTMREIGRVLGLSQSTVSRHIRAARTKLEKLKAFVE